MALDEKLRQVSQLFLQKGIQLDSDWLSGLVFRAIIFIRYKVIHIQYLPMFFCVFQMRSVFYR